MENACRTNITVKALAEDCEPDHDTIATFISTNGEAVKDLFVQVLMQCDELELIKGEMFAVDGCKLPSNASKEWSGTMADLKRKKARMEKQAVRLMRRHRELDKNEKVKKIQEPYRATMGNDRERREKCEERLKKKLRKVDEFLKTAEPKKGVSGAEVQTNVTDPESARIKSPHGYIQGYNGIAMADSGNQVIISAEAVGSGPEAGSFPKMLESLEVNMRKITKKKKPLKKSLVLGDTGFFSEENLQEAERRNIEVIIPDPQFRMRDPDFEEREKAKAKKRYAVEDFSYDAKKDCYICPRKKTLAYKGEIKLRNNEGRKYQASQRDCSQCPNIGECINLKHWKAEGGAKHSRTLYIVTQKYTKNLSGEMKKKIDDPAYRELYSRRQQIIEPVFSDITYCKKMNRFTLRTQKKVNIQWQLYCIVHNIGKCAAAIKKKKMKAV
jgi:hypothetical protein